MDFTTALNDLAMVVQDIQRRNAFNPALPVSGPALFFPRGEILATAGKPGDQEFTFAHDHIVYLRLFPAMVVARLPAPRLPSLRSACARLPLGRHDRWRKGSVVTIWLHYHRLCWRHLDHRIHARILNWRTLARQRRAVHARYLVELSPTDTGRTHYSSHDNLRKGIHRAVEEASIHFAYLSQHYCGNTRPIRRPSAKFTFHPLTISAPLRRNR